MVSRLFLSLFLSLLLAFPGSVNADELKIAVVDFSRAINEIPEGQGAQARLEAMYQGKRAEIEQLEANLRALSEEYESRAAVLSETARQDYQRRLTEGQAAYQQAYVQSESDMQTAYVQVMEQLLTRLKDEAGVVGQELGYNLVLESSQGAVLFSSPTMDITDQVIARFNAGD